MLLPAGAFVRSGKPTPPHPPNGSLHDEHRLRPANSIAGSGQQRTATSAERGIGMARRRSTYPTQSTVMAAFWPKIELLRSDTEHQPRRLILKQVREDYRTLRAPNTDQLSRRCTVKKITTHTPPPD